SSPPRRLPPPRTARAPAEGRGRSAPGAAGAPDAASGQRAVLLPAGKGPARVAQPVQVGQDEGAVDGGMQRLALRPANDRPGHVELRGDAALARDDELGGW